MAESILNDQITSRCLFSQNGRHWLSVVQSSRLLRMSSQDSTTLKVHFASLLASSISGWSKAVA
jgi:hypothetical protein